MKSLNSLYFQTTCTAWTEGRRRSEREKPGGQVLTRDDPDRGDVAKKGMDIARRKSSGEIDSLQVAKSCLQKT